MGIILLFPLLIIRFWIMPKLSYSAVKEANYFAPLRNKEKYFYIMYQITNFLLVFLPLLYQVNIYSYLGWIVYILGIALVLITIIHFSDKSNSGLRVKGVYKYSRNPMYICYFIYFLGCSLLLNSWIYFLVLLVFQLSAHWIILSEERWCEKNYGDSYLSYKDSVRRYI